MFSVLNWGFRPLFFCFFVEFSCRICMIVYQEKFRGNHPGTKSQVPRKQRLLGKKYKKHES